MSSIEGICIDTQCGLGIWPLTGAGFKNLAELEDKHLMRYGIGEAWINRVEGLLTEDASVPDGELASLIAGKINFRLVPTIDPTQANAVSRVRRELENPQCVALRIAPGFHHYPLYARCVNALCDAVMEIRPVPIMILTRMDDERARLTRLNLVPVPCMDVLALASRYSQLPFVVQGAVRGEAVSMICHKTHHNHENIYIDTSFLDGLDALEQAVSVNTIPVERILWATAEPFLYAAANVLMLEKCGLPPDNLKAITHDNAMTLSRGSLE